MERKSRIVPSINTAENRQSICKSYRDDAQLMIDNPDEYPGTKYMANKYGFC